MSILLASMPDNGGLVGGYGWADGGVTVLYKYPKTESLGRLSKLFLFDGRRWAVARMVLILSTSLGDVSPIIGLVVSGASSKCGIRFKPVLNLHRW